MLWKLFVPAISMQADLSDMRYRLLWVGGPHLLWCAYGNDCGTGVRVCRYRVSPLVVHGIDA